MHNFTFKGVSLSQFGGRILQAPFHTVAKRNVDFEKIYGQSGDEIIDNESYDNISFSIKISFLPLLSEQTARELAYAIIDWLAPLQNGYYTYRDTYNPGYFTKAVLININDVVRELPTLLTTTLKFNRVPFWYRDDGVDKITIKSTGSTIVNPENYTSEPVYEFYYPYLDGQSRDAVITVNGVATTFSGVVYPRTYYFDNVEKQHYYISNGSKIYISDILLPNLCPGNNTISITVGSMMQGSFSLKVTPNWRRL